MTALRQLRDAVATALATDERMSERKIKVSVHGGDFKVSDLQTYAKDAPCVVVALLHSDTENEHATGELWADAVFGLCCMARPKPAWDKAADQHSACLDVVDTVLRVINGNWWGELDVKAPQGVNARNMFTAALDKVGGIAMWAVGFHQLVELKDETDPSIPWLRWHATFDPMPTDPERPHMEASGELEQEP